MGNSLELYRTILGLLVRAIPHSAYGHLGHARLGSRRFAARAARQPACLGDRYPQLCSLCSQSLPALTTLAAQSKVDPQAIYGPLIRAALSKWEGVGVYIALDTTVLWNKFVIIRASLIYPGWAIPLT